MRLQYLGLASPGPALVGGSYQFCTSISLSHFNHLLKMVRIQNEIPRGQRGFPRCVLAPSARDWNQTSSFSLSRFGNTLSPTCSYTRENPDQYLRLCLFRCLKGFALDLIVPSASLSFPHTTPLTKLLSKS